LHLKRLTLLPKTLLLNFIKMAPDATHPLPPQVVGQPSQTAQPPVAQEPRIHDVDAVDTVETAPIDDRNTDPEGRWIGASLVIDSRSQTLTHSARFAALTRARGLLNRL
jgi:hypothetical protein